MRSNFTTSSCTVSCIRRVILCLR